MLVGALPGLAAVTGALMLAMGEGDALHATLYILASLMVMAAFVGLGHAMRKRVRWSFKVAAWVFGFIALGSLVGVFVGDVGKVGVRFLVLLPLVFSASAYLAERAVSKHEDAVRAAQLR